MSQDEHVFEAAEDFTCSRCLDKFGRQDAANRGHGE